MQKKEIIKQIQEAYEKIDAARSILEDAAVDYWNLELSDDDIDKHDELVDFAAEAEALGDKIVKEFNLGDDNG